MLRIDCFGKTRLALHVPSSHELESVDIIIIIMHASAMLRRLAQIHPVLPKASGMQQAAFAA